MNEVFILALIAVFTNILKEKDGPEFFIFKGGLVKKFKEFKWEFKDKVLGCNFCTSFWTVLVFGLFLAKNPLEYILYVISATALSMVMLAFTGRL